MELKDTINLMISNDNKENFLAEYHQTKKRYTELNNMLNNWREGKLNFTPICPRNLFNMQVKIMGDYLTVLEARAIIEGIQLGE